MTLLCKRKNHGKILYLFLCNGEWLKVVWIVVSFFVCILLKGMESNLYYVYIKFCYFYILVFFFLL